METVKRWAIVAKYLSTCNRDTGHLAQDDMIEMVQFFGRSERAIRRYVQDYRTQVENQVVVPDLADARKGAAGRKSTLTEEVKNKIYAANNSRRGHSTIRGISAKTNIPKSTVQDHCVKLKCELKTQWVKPTLSVKQKVARLKFILSRIDMKNECFKSFRNCVHVDESWFYLTAVRSWTRYFPGQPEPMIFKTKHKKHIPKVMFVIAIGFPDEDKEFDGKIGVWRVSTAYVAKRNGKYHDKGDVYQKDCTVTASWYRNCMVGDGGIMEKIADKMEDLGYRTVTVQHDGAPGHTGEDNMAVFEEEGAYFIPHISVITQPSNSPDMNVLDLGFFRSLKCVIERVKEFTDNLDELIEHIEEEFSSYDTNTILRIWAHQLDMYRCILKASGDNTFREPHSGVRKRQSNGDPVMDYSVNMADVRRAQRYILQNDT